MYMPWVWAREAVGALVVEAVEGRGGVKSSGDSAK